MAEPATVKSAERVLKLLELFAEERTPLSAADISRRLGWPKSSANILLRSLVGLGYLTLDENTIEYFPSPRVTRLGDWIPHSLAAGDDVLRRLEELHDRTGETVTLSMQNGFEMMFVTVLPGTFPISLTMSDGFSAPLFNTAVGIALLATESDEAVRRLVQRANRRRAPLGRRIDVNRVLDEVHETRERGLAVGYERVFPDTGALAMAIPSPEGGRRLVVGVGGLAARIHRSEAQIIDAMRKCFGVKPGRMVSPAPRRVGLP
jgi:DNA-binding IclR family transcriptional regulator